jgi:hypothetical protein
MVVLLNLAKILNNFVRKDKDIIVSLSNFTLKYKLNFRNCSFIDVLQSQLLLLFYILQSQKGF